MWKQEQALRMTETTGARLADLDRAINAIHYEPSICTEEDLERLEEISKLIEKATRLAEEIARFE